VNNKIILLFLVLFVLTMMIIPMDVYAIHQSNELSWKLIMISSYPACSNYHYQMTNHYHEVTEKYLALYQLNNEYEKPTCMTEEKFVEYETPEELDLIILVYDRNIGRDVLHTQNMGGFYSHFGDEWTHNHTIIFCDCSDFTYSTPNWILSHELSHFVLYYLGYDKSIVENMIHEKDMKADNCVEVEYLESCTEIRFRMETINHDITVMAPYPPAIGKDIMNRSENVEISMSPYIMKMQMEITKWWMDEKINDLDYVTSLELLLEKEVKRDSINELFYSMEFPNVVFTDPPKDKKLENVNSSVMSGSEITALILDILPYEKKYKQNLIEEKESQTLPQWFKTRADWWALGEIDDSEYLTGMMYYLTR